MERKSGLTVLVIDSGIGGMSIVKQIRSLEQDVSVVYLADNALFPYGDKHPETLIQRLQYLIATVTSQCHIDAVVIGCNTATVLVIDTLRNLFQMPFVGVVPAIKTAAEISKTRNFTLVATENTANSDYIDNLIENFAQDCSVLRLGCPGLADLVEDKIYGREVSQQSLDVIFSEAPKAELEKSDVIVLGCTHYAYIMEELRDYFRDDQLIIEPSLPVAKRTQWILNQIRQNQIGHDTKSAAQLAIQSNRFLLTKNLQVTSQLNQFLISHGFTSTEEL